MLHCILSDCVPSNWAPALAIADETGLEPRDEKELNEWLKANDLTGAEVFQFGPESNGSIRCAVFADDKRPAVPVFFDRYDAREWLEHEFEAERWPRVLSFEEFLTGTRCHYGAEDQALIDEILEDLHDDDE